MLPPTQPPHPPHPFLSSSRKWWSSLGNAIQTPALPRALSGVPQEEAHTGWMSDREMTVHYPLSQHLYHTCVPHHYAPSPPPLPPFCQPLPATVPLRHFTAYNHTSACHPSTRHHSTHYHQPLHHQHEHSGLPQYQTATIIIITLSPPSLCHRRTLSLVANTSPLPPPPDHHHLLPLSPPSRSPPSHHLHLQPTPSPRSM